MPISRRTKAASLPPRRAPVPKAKPARLGSLVARIRGHNIRKPKSR